MGCRCCWIDGGAVAMEDIIGGEGRCKTATDTTTPKLVMR